MDARLISTTAATMTQVASDNQRGMPSYFFDDPKRSPKPQVIGILSNVVTMGRLAQTVHDQILAHDAFLTSSADKYEKAYIVEYRKLLQASDANKAMGRDIENLRRDNAKYKDLDALSHHLRKDLHTYQTRYHQLDELNIQVEKRNEELMDINANMEDIVTGLKNQIHSLEARLQEAQCQPLCANEKREDIVCSTAQADVEDESRPSPLTSSDNMGSERAPSPERLSQSLKRKHNALEEDFDTEKAQRKVRRRH